MKKYFTRGLLASFVVASFFAFNTFISVTPASAQTMSLCQTVEALIGAGVIAPAKANAARAAAGCATSTSVPTPAFPEVTFVSQSIRTESLDGGGTSQAVGTFKFKVTAIDSDAKVSKNLHGAIGIMYGISSFIGVPQVANLSSAYPGKETPDYFLVQEGDTVTFTISYIINPYQGSGFYRASLVKLVFDGVGMMDLNGPENKFVSNAVSLVGPDIVTQTVPIATITGTPTLKLTYDSKRKESLLTANFKGYFTAASNSSDYYVPTVPFYGQMVTGPNITARVNSGKTETTVVDKTGATPKKTKIEGTEYYIIPKGTTAWFDSTSTVKPSELFAGSYYAKLFGTWMPNLQETIEISNQAMNASNQVTIIGETSPYIKAVTSPVMIGKKMTIDGLRLDKSKVYIDGNVLSNVTIASPTGGNSLYFNLPNLSVGYHSLYLVNSSTGKSNNVSFEVRSSAVSVVLSASPTSIVSDGKPGTVTLSWSSTNATYCNFEKRRLAPAGDLDIPITLTGSYNISCTGPGGTVSSNLVTVTFQYTSQPPVAQPSITPTQSTIKSGESVKFTLTYPQNTAESYLYITCPAGITSGISPEVCNGQKINVTSNLDWTLHLFNSTSQSHNVSVSYQVIDSNGLSTSIGQTITVLSGVSQSSITITLPNGRETFTLGQFVTLKFNIQSSKKYGVSYYLIPQSGTAIRTGDGTYFDPISGGYSFGGVQPNSITAQLNQGAYIPNDIIAGSYKIRAYLRNFGDYTGSPSPATALAYDDSDNYFTITTPVVTPPVSQW